MGASDTTEKDWEEHWRSEQLEEAYQQGRADAIEECKSLFRKYILTKDIEGLDKLLEQLKE